MLCGRGLTRSMSQVRHDVNRDFYGSAVSSAHVLDGRVPPPVSAAPLYAALAHVMKSKGTRGYHAGDAGVSSPLDHLSSYLGWALLSQCLQPTATPGPFLVLLRTIMSPHIRGAPGLEGDLSPCLSRFLFLHLF